MKAQKTTTTKQTTAKQTATSAVTRPVKAKPGIKVEQEKVEPRKPKSKIKIPKKLGEVADMLWDVREKQKEIKKQLDELEAQESDLKDHLINNLGSSQSATGVAGNKCRVTVETKDVPTVKDWNSLWTYIVKNKAFDLVQRRVSTSAVEARWDDGKKIPGVEPFGVKKLSINKV